VKSGLENRDYGRRGSAALTMRHPSIRKIWPKSGGLSVDIVRSRTKATELVSANFIEFGISRPRRFRF
jgi:hypothetical protein